MIEVINKKFETLIDKQSPIEEIGNQFLFTEGPVWQKIKNCLYFSDISGNTIYSYSRERGIEPFRHPSGFSNGLTLNRKGNLIACEHRTRAITAQTQDGFQILANSYKGKKLNSPNDLVLTRDGMILFTDPIFGLWEGSGGPGEQELPFEGVFLLKPYMSEPRLLFDDFERPNGLAFSNDYKTLYVNDTNRQHIRAFTVEEDWKFTENRVFAELFGEGEGRPDGMKLDVFGNVFCTGPGGIWVFSPAGELLGKIYIEKPVSNMAWGDADFRSLYITARNSLYRLRCKTKGISPMEIWQS